MAVKSFAKIVAIDKEIVMNKETFPFAYIGFTGSIHFVSCPKCSSGDLLLSPHIDYTQTEKRLQYHCQDCGNWFYGWQPSPKSVKLLF